MILHYRYSRHSVSQILSHICNPYRVAEGKAKKSKDFHDDLGSEEEVETAPEKRLRLAKEYLARLEEEG